MARAKAKQRVMRGVRMESLAAEGKSLAHTEHGTLFAGRCVPGDIVDIRIARKRKGVLEGQVELLRAASCIRQQPICEHFDHCGGCQWQLLPYTLQLAMKQEQVEAQLQRIGHVRVGRMLPILPATPTLAYRNKLEFTFSPRGWRTEPVPEGVESAPFQPALGFHIPGRFDRILDIRYCHLQAEPSNALRNAIRAYALAQGFSFYDAKTQQGWLRGMIVRTSRLGQTMLLIAFAYDDPLPRVQLLESISTQFPELRSVMWCVNDKVNDTLYDVQMHLWRGVPFIEERLGRLVIAIGPKSFYQTNSRQGERLYGVVRGMASLKGHETLYDLYCGTGTIGLFLAADAGRVVGVETVPEAVEDALRNAQRNQVGNIRFVAGDVLQVVNAEFIARYGEPDVVITDPPRAGMHPDVVRKLLEINAPRIVYVSCNPATQARDLSMLSPQYDVVAVQPVDMFPHTKHVECCALLERRG